MFMTFECLLCCDHDDSAPLNIFAYMVKHPSSVVFVTIPKGETAKMKCINKGRIMGSKKGAWERTG